MKRLALILLLMMTTRTTLAGEWIFSPDSSGTTRITLTGGASESGPDFLVQRQLAGDSLNVQILAAGEGVCENGVLKGKGSLESFQISFNSVKNGVTESGNHIKCGELLSFDKHSEAQLSGVKATPEINRTRMGNLAKYRTHTRVLLGNINFMHADGTSMMNSLYLDLSNVISETAHLSAAFDKPVISLGEINMQSNIYKTLKLRVGKTLAASDESFQYMLSFESSQVKNNGFQLKSTTDEIYVPYQVKISETNLVPGAQYMRTMPSGSSSIDIIDLGFYVQGKHVNGIRAGTHLMDTVTAIVTPKS